MWGRGMVTLSHYKPAIRSNSCYSSNPDPSTPHPHQHGTLNCYTPILTVSPSSKSKYTAPMHLLQKHAIFHLQSSDTVLHSQYRHYESQYQSERACWPRSQAVSFERCCLGLLLNTFCTWSSCRGFVTALLRARLKSYLVAEGNERACDVLGRCRQMTLHQRFSSVNTQRKIKTHLL